MTDTAALFAPLDRAADPAIASAIRQLVETGPDAALCRINPLAFAAGHGFDGAATVSAFLHAASLGLFDMSWNVLCPGCGGVLDSNTSLRTVVRDHYVCNLCAQNYEPTLDELVEITFTVNSRARRIAAHDPDSLTYQQYMRQLYFSSAIDIDDAAFEATIDEIVLDSIELQAGERAVMSVQLPPGFVIVFEPVTHEVQFIDASGEPMKERQALAMILDREHPHRNDETLVMGPGPLRLSLENRTNVRVLPALMLASDALHRMMARRRPFLTAKSLLSNQTFRDLYRTDTIDVDQRLKITSLTFLFTDLRGSTELYERVGDLAAFDLVRNHFRVLHEIVASEAGAVVKTIGDAVMATFATPDRAVAAALRMRDAMRQLNSMSGREDLVLKIGLHEGPCIAVSMNERQDYFGSTVNIASRVQGLAEADAIFVTGAVLDDVGSASVLASRDLKPVSRNAALRGVEREVQVYAIP